MAEGFAALVVLLALLGIIVGLIALIWPIQRIGLGSRKRALGAIGGSVIAMILAGAIMPAESSSGGKSSKAVPPAAGETKAQLQAQSDSLWEQLKNETDPCDNYVQAAGQQVGRLGSGTASIADAYEAADKAKETCQRGWLALGDLTPPPAARGEVKAAYDTALETCKTAAFVKRSAMEKLAEVLNGAARPSDQVELKQALTDARNGGMMCGLTYLEATSKAGVTLKEFEEAQARAKAKAGAKTE